MGSTATASLLLLLAAVPSVFAVTFQVGDTAGWDAGVDYTTWVTGKTFRLGDTLEFKYGASHSISVVDKAGFDSCDSSGATQSFIDGDTKIDLTKVGTLHFICPTPGHCPGGMKLAVTVLPAATTPSPKSPPSSPKTPAVSPKSSPKSPSISPKSSPKSPSLAPKSPRKPNTLAPSASPPVANTPESASLTPTVSPTPSQNAASKKVMSYGIFGVTMVLLYGLMS